MTIALDAMMFAMDVHCNHKRRYTKTPYFTHLSEVAGIVATVNGEPGVIATAYLHDCVEDVGVTEGTLRERFGPAITGAVLMLSDLEEGNRAERKEASRQRLARAPGWVQSIKCADLISNTGSIVQFDPKFAVTYLEEKRALLAVLARADKNLHALATKLANQPVGMGVML